VVATEGKVVPCPRCGRFGHTGCPWCRRCREYHIGIQCNAQRKCARCGYSRGQHRLHGCYRFVYLCESCKQHWCADVKLAKWDHQLARHGVAGAAYTRRIRKGHDGPYLDNQWCWRCRLAERRPIERKLRVLRAEQEIESLQWEAGREEREERYQALLERRIRIGTYLALRERRRRAQEYRRWLESPEGEPERRYQERKRQRQCVNQGRETLQAIRLLLRTPARLESLRPEYERARTSPNQCPP
jgi:hypothetical protein